MTAGNRINAYEFRRRGREWVVVRPAGAAETKVAVDRADGATIDVLLGAVIRTRDGLHIYRVADMHFVPATSGQMAALNRMLRALKAYPGRADKTFLLEH